MHSYYLTYYFDKISYPIIYPIVTFAYRKVKNYPIKNSKQHTLWLRDLQDVFSVSPVDTLFEDSTWLDLTTKEKFTLVVTFLQYYAIHGYTYLAW